METMREHSLFRKRVGWLSLEVGHGLLQGGSKLNAFSFLTKKRLDHPGFPFDLYQWRENTPRSLHASALS